VTLDDQESIVAMNTSVSKLFGFQPSDLLFLHVTKLLPEFNVCPLLSAPFALCLPRLCL